MPKDDCRPLSASRCLTRLYNIQFHKNTTLINVLTQLNAIHIFRSYKFSYVLIFILPRISLPGFIIKTLYEFLFFFVYTTCPANLIFLCDGQMQISPLPHNLCPPTAYSLIGPNLLDLQWLWAISTCAAMYTRSPLFWDVRQSSGSQLPTFRNNLSGSSTRVKLSDCLSFEEGTRYVVPKRR